MLKRKVGLIIVLLVCFGFVFSKGIEAEGGTCSCVSIRNGLLLDHYDVSNNCNDGYEPYYGDLGYGCGCECKLDGTADSLKTDKDKEVTGNSSGGYDPTCTKDGLQGIQTAIGCIPVEMGEFIPWLMTWLFGIAGGIAFLLMVYGFILIATSSGDEKKIQGAKETITSAIIGLLVCIFSVFILRLIAVNILQIPGL